MKKMRDDDAVCYQQALAKLKEVGEEITEVLKMFPEEASTETSIGPTEEHRPSLIEQVQSISVKMVKYIHLSIHTGIL